MRLKNMWKRFWTLDVHNHAGFTLVELIIVIAILAILSTGAIAGYSAYVESANKTSDKALIAELKNVLTLAYYNGDLTENVILILSADKDVENVEENSQLDKILDDAYGTNWRSALKLKHADWGGLGASSFGSAANGISGLVGTVDKLTGALSSALGIFPGIAGDNFMDYAESMLGEEGAKDDQAKANAAVFYVADLTGDMSSDDLTSAYEAMISGFMSNSGSAQDKTIAAMEGMNDHTHSTLGSAALMYAIAMGFAEDYNKKNPDKLDAEDNPGNILNKATDGIADAAGNGQIESAADAFSKLADAFQEMFDKNPDAARDYYNNMMSTDVAAYADALKTISASKNSIIDNNGAMSSKDYFSTPYISGMLSSYAEGGVFIEIRVEDGEMEITSTIDDKE